MAEADRRAAQHKSDVIYDENVELLHEIENSELVQESYRLRESCDSYIGRLHWYNPNQQVAGCVGPLCPRHRRPRRSSPSPPPPAHPPPSPSPPPPPPSLPPSLPSSVRTERVNTSHETPDAGAREQGGHQLHHASLLASSAAVLP